MPKKRDKPGGDKPGDKGDKTPEQEVSPADLAKVLVTARRGTEPVEFEFGGEKWTGRALTWIEEVRVSGEAAQKIKTVADEYGLKTDISRKKDDKKGTVEEELEGVVPQQIIDYFYIAARLAIGIVEGPEWWKKYGVEATELSSNDIANLYLTYRAALSGFFRAGETGGDEVRNADPGGGGRK